MAPVDETGATPSGEPDALDLQAFTPYLLNQAAEAQSDVFAKNYRNRYGMLRTEWRVLLHLGRYGELSASEITALSGIHKTKISRAVRALEEKRFVARVVDDGDRRSARLSLRPPGQEAFRHLTRAARAYEAQLEEKLGREDAQRLRVLLRRLQKQA